jgi:riboflavin synthase
LGEVFAKTPAEGQTDLTVRVPPGLERFVVSKGSIAIDGVSLTVAHVLDRDVTVCLIPHTLEVTTLGSLSPGDAVHLEMDMIGKWVQRLLVQP